jgi:hypothetical protein
MDQNRTMNPRPVAVRAVALALPARWSRRTVRRVRYDALWPGGRVEFDVSLVDMMSRGAPADYSPISHAVNDRCPEVGAGPWIDDWAFEVDGPALPEGRPVDPGEGARRKFRPPPDEPPKAHPTLWRVVVGLALLAAGTTGLTANGFEGFVAFLWSLLTICGLGLLGGLIKRGGHQ